MKKIKILSAFLVLFSFMGLISCDTEPVDPVLNNNQEEEGPGTAIFKVDFSGQTHTGSGIVATIGGELIQIAAVLGPNGESIAIGIDGTSTGTYSSDKLLMGYDPGNDSEETYNNFTLDQESGIVTITSINTTNHTMSGTFSFTGWYGDEAANKPAIVFTNGVFENITYTGTGGPGPGPNPEEGENSFSAKVDGELYDYSDYLDVLVSGPDGEKRIAIMGSVINDTTMSLTVFSNFTAGTYNLGTGFSDPGASFMDEEGNGYFIENGSVTVQSNTNGRIKGTFNYLVKNEEGETVYTVTDGKFDVEWDF